MNLVGSIFPDLDLVHRICKKVVELSKFFTKILFQQSWFLVDNTEVDYEKQKQIYMVELHRDLKN